MKTNIQYPQARETKLVLCFGFSGNNTKKLYKWTSKEILKNSFFRNNAVVLLKEKLWKENGSAILTSAKVTKRDWDGG